MLYHDSRNPAYRTPPGAGACLSRVLLRVQCSPAPDRVFLRLWWADRAWLIRMRPAEHAFYEAEITLPAAPGILWYFFFAETAGGRAYYGNAHDQLGGQGASYDHEPPSFQLTVYDPAYETPAWMRDGLVYQIMVDRFHASRPVARRRAPEDGHWHADWHEPPELKLTPDERDNYADDFFGGDLRGVEEKLPYLQSLGVTVLYLNPIFRAPTNHKYDTGDYKQIDPTFGTEEDFRRLCERAGSLGIRILLDGVFSHTGADSRYFNRFGRYPELGAYQSKDSPYASWYTFMNWPGEYDSWWGITTLPNVREMDPGYLDFIIEGEDAVCAKWIRAGASGWRLDVADELPMDFLRRLRARVKREAPGAAVLGEVWEDASNKVSYGQMRSYCLGDTLDSCMNYPLRAVLLDFMLGRTDAHAACRRIEHLLECYPPQFSHSLMNLLGSHDKPRVIDVLSGEDNLEPPREQRRARTLSPEQYALGRRRFEALWRFLCAFPGMPSLYYADEAGQTGMADPFCRGTYPWGREDRALLKSVRAAALERGAWDVLRRGATRLYAPSPEVLVVARRIAQGCDALGEAGEDALALCLLNRSDQSARARLLRDDWLEADMDLLLAPESARTLLVGE